ncbi:META domain-containing protein [Myroides odoratus]|uniref:META domain-containing protein n=1 Tax=Myroides odoratus TaxID=256 RepID=UPI0039B128D5
MKKIGLIMALISFVLSAGCKSQAISKDTQTETSIPMNTTSKLDGEWELIAIQSSAKTEENVQDLFPLKKPFLIVDSKEMSFHGHNGCNIYQGTIEAIDANILLLDKKIVSTRKYCEGVNSPVYMSALGKVKDYQMEQDVLTLTSEDQNVFLKFKKIEN